MRALLSHKVGGPETLVVATATKPTAGPGQVVINVKACAINFPDLLIIEDRYQLKPPRPFAPGGEVAGIIESVGPGAGNWKRGDRVIGFSGFGGLAEQVAIDAKHVYRLPAERDFLEGAALLFTYGTALHGLRGRGRLQAGERLLVLGAAGGVGMAAVQLGKALGAHVIAAASNSQKAQAAIEGGADEALVYGRGPFAKDETRALSDQFKQVAGEGGFDVIFDTVGGDYAEPALRAIGWGGRYLVIGFPAGIPRLPLNLALLKGCDICGVFWGTFADLEPEKCAGEVATLFDLWSKGLITPSATHVFSLSEGGKAIARLAARENVGKIVVSMSD